MPNFPAKSPASTRILPGLRDIVANYDVILCDIWGVLHDGEKHFPAAADALSRARASGIKVVLITNAPRPHGPIRAQLDHLRVPRDAYDDLVTSGDTTVALIAAHGRDKCFHIGPPRDLTLFDEVPALTGHRLELTSLDNSDYAVCTGLFDDDTETPGDYAARFAAMLARKMPMICANPDLVVHRGATLLYCAGALAKLYEEMGGTAIYAGKPHGPIYERALQLAGARQGARVLAIGDALATDILGAHRQGFDALFATHGIHRHDLHPGGVRTLDGGRLAALLAGGGLCPEMAMAELAW